MEQTDKQKEFNENFKECANTVSNQLGKLVEDVETNFHKSTVSILNTIREIKSYLMKQDPKGWKAYKQEQARIKEVARDPVKYINKDLDRLDKLEAKIKEGNNG